MQSHPLITVEDFYESCRSKLSLQIICCREVISDINVTSRNMNVLGLELNDFFEGFREHQIQILDSKAYKYLSSIGSKQFDKVIKSLFSYDITAVVFTASNKPPEIFIDIAQANGIPVLTSTLTKWEFINIAEKKLEEMLAPKKDCRGTMMEVFGLGVLITGKSNVGKSECAIDLLKRGHRMIGDDVVEVTRRGTDVLIARGKHPISHRMELRGIGIIDVIELFGVSAVKEVEKIEMVIELEKWASDKTYERLGFEEKYTEILGAEVPYLVIPVAPGRNSAILVEVAAMNHRLRRRGIVPANELEKEVLQSYPEQKNF